MKKIFTTAVAYIIYLITAPVFAQHQITISGKVISNAGTPITAVTISLINAKDSAIYKTSISDNNGKFKMLADTGKTCLLHYSMVGYDEKYSKSFLLKENIDVTETLENKSSNLAAVTVVAKKPLIEIKADKIIFNVEGSINAQGSNALELLQKSPGVRVDNNDNIALKGKSGVKVYIDGKMTQLDSKGLAEYLRGINSDDVESIEIINNPGAKYDASGNADIINIKLKKNKKYGTNGSANIGFTQGVKAKANSGLNLNYRNKKLNIFGTASASIGDRYNSQDIYRIQNDTIFDQKNVSSGAYHIYNLKIGADLFINKKSTLGVMVTGGVNNNLWTNQSNTNIWYAPSKTFEKTLAASNAIYGERFNINNNINYRYADTTGIEINVDADYGVYRNKANSFQPNYYKNASGHDLYSVINRNNTPTDIDIYSFKADMEMPKWKGKLGFGVKTAYVTTNNLFEFFANQNNIPIKNLARSNNFNYTENVNAAYLNYSKELNKKLSFQSGLRLEQTNSEGLLKRADGQTQADEDIERHYLNLFPSSALTYKVNDKNTLNLTYSRRIDRPSYHDLNPFENKLDELTYEKGNAFLRPQYGNNIELSHTYNGMFTTTLGYSKVKDFSTQTIDTTNGNATYVQQRNLAYQQVFSIAVNANYHVGKWYNGYISLYSGYQTVKGDIDTRNINMSATSYGGYMQHSFTLGKDYKAELTGWLNGPAIDGNIRSKAFGAMDVGIQKELLHKNAIIKLSVTDILNTAKWNGVSEFSGLYARFLGKWENQTVRLNFTYRFGSTNINKSRERKAGLENESNRIK